MKENKIKKNYKRVRRENVLLPDILDPRQQSKGLQKGRHQPLLSKAHLLPRQVKAIAHAQMPAHFNSSSSLNFNM